MIYSGQTSSMWAQKNSKMQLKPYNNLLFIYHKIYEPDFTENLSYSLIHIQHLSEHHESTERNFYIDTGMWNYKEYSKMENTVLGSLMSSVKSSAGVKAFDKGTIARRHSSGFSPHFPPFLPHALPNLRVTKIHSKEREP